MGLDRICVKRKADVCGEEVKPLVEVTPANTGSALIAIASTHNLRLKVYITIFNLQPRKTLLEIFSAEAVRSSRLLTVKPVDEVEEATREKVLCI